MDFTTQIIEWNIDAGNTHDHFNTRQTAMYLGLMCEELSEVLYAVNMNGIAHQLEQVGHELKEGRWDAAVRDGDRLEMLDGAVDQIVVSTGFAMSQGANLHKAMYKVLASLNAKRFPDGTLHKDSNGKIIKPEGWQEPDLRDCLDKDGQTQGLL